MSFFFSLFFFWRESFFFSLWSIRDSSSNLFHERYASTNLEFPFSGMDFYELLDIPQGDRRKYHDDVTIMVISLEGRIWKSSGTYVWCSADILSMSVFIPMQYSAEMNFSRSALPGNCIYAHQEGKVWHGIQICSPYTCQSGVLQLILTSALAQLVMLMGELGQIKVAEKWQPGREEFLGKAEPICSVCHHSFV